MTDSFITFDAVFQETSDGTAQYSPVGAVPILHFQPLMPASATAKEESHSLMDTGYPPTIPHAQQLTVKNNFTYATV